MIDFTGVLLVVLGILAGNAGLELVSWILFFIALAASGDKLTFALILLIRAAFVIVRTVWQDVPHEFGIAGILIVLFYSIWASQRTPSGPPAPESYAPR